MSLTFSGGITMKFIVLVSILLVSFTCFAQGDSTEKKLGQVVCVERSFQIKIESISTNLMTTDQGTTYRANIILFPINGTEQIVSQSIGKDGLDYYGEKGFVHFSLNAGGYSLIITNGMNILDSASAIALLNEANGALQLASKTFSVRVNRVDDLLRQAL